ncbi:Scaffold protein for [4Fe-4S] cluster assembly ApbC, MRP-like [hydrothermal vent metagenome]|jgi:ATP-binding protein involved in chromosome partitioning|uniref:Scaffold protein for [4Fe-4S] cluster assembly ApbC, MRP-like n=1 Tax=hydrothermal vent metagenome TaxID=652676 RepID=A0A160TWU6_9ZZZZ|tara:strand:+ start:68 stop:1159 length:1092 start_codon:yes stop_codon:yes gene_type:complete
MSTVTKDTIEEALSGIVDPHTGLDLVTGKSVNDCVVDNQNVSIDLVLGYPAKGWHPNLKQEVVDVVSKLENIQSVDVRIKTQVVSHEVQKGVTPLKNVRNVIAVASGKGGVGKSTVSANLALALSAEGAKAGVLDADIYGPSQPRMLGVGGRPESKDGKSLEPMNSYHVQVMSIGFLIEEDTPMIWRGPMVTQALEQLLQDTQWRDLDYLIIDLPPGTGDIQLTLAQKVPVSGAVIVTTPQDIALLDARKALKMFEKVEIPVLGIIENMSTHICSNCGHEEHIFGEGGGKRMSVEYSVEHLGDIPLDGRIRSDADGGRPTVVADPDGSLAQAYRTIARNASGILSVRKRDYSEVFPSIVIQND